MKVLLTGASGFVGRRLVSRLLAEGHALHVLGRGRPAWLPSDVAFSPWDSSRPDPDGASTNSVTAAQKAEAVIHLAGEPVAQRWNREVKSRIRDSRVLGTKALASAIRQQSAATGLPHTFVSASAIGYYGNRADEILTEESSRGSGFLSDVCSEWEQAAFGAGVRTAILRVSIVLGKEGGALKQMLPPFRLGVGGPIGAGSQWMSWIHADDLVTVILRCLTDSNLSGPINAAAPNPVRNVDFARALGSVLGRPAVVRTPEFALKLMLGEAAAVVLASQRVVPAALDKAGYSSWAHPEIRSALAWAVE